MSHIHVPDGFIPPLWWLTGWLLCGVALFFLIRRLKGDDVRRRMPFVGVVSALMLITMNVPLGIIPLHLSLAVLSGILAGPALGFMAVFVVVLLMALFGHGGITVVGINTLILGSEAVLGYYIFHLLRRHIQKVPAAAVAVVLALLVSTALMLGVLSGTVGAAEILPHGPYEEGAVETQESDGEEAHDFWEQLSEVRYLIFTGWTALITLLSAGILLETLATVLIVQFFNRVRPDLVEGVYALS